MKLSDLKVRLPSGKIARGDQFYGVNFHCEDGNSEYYNLGEVEVLEDPSPESSGGSCETLNKISIKLMEINEDYIENLKKQVDKNEKQD